MVDGATPDGTAGRLGPRRGERGKVHIRDVARFAGVSHQTVSRVLNNQPMVRPETRDRVLLAIRELDYRPSVAARALNTGRTRTLGVITFDATRYGPVSVLHGIGEAAWDCGYLVSTVALRAPDPGSVRQTVNRLTDQAVDGIIVIAAQESVARALSELPPAIPMVMLDTSFDERIPAVGVDEFDAGRQATEHLLRRGHPTVWHLAGPTGWIAAQGRRAGWRHALEAAGAPVPPPLYGDWSADSGYHLGRQLAGPAGVTAIFAANDQMALGLLRALREAGRRVPEDVSVVGFDDIPEAPYLVPALTTMRPDFTGIGQRCLTVLLGQLAAAPAPSPRTLVPASLVIRHSTAPAPIH